MLVAPFLRPPGGIGDTPPLPYYLYCLVGIGAVALGALYWAAWRIFLPRVLGIELAPRKDVLKDGTVVSVVRRIAYYIILDMCLVSFQFDWKKVQ